jgi:hypothetical protein
VWSGGQHYDWLIGFRDFDHSAAKAGLVKAKYKFEVGSWIKLEWLLLYRLISAP